MPDKETKKLFDEDGYADSFEAKVLAVRKDIEQKNTAQKTAENQQRVKEERTAEEERITEERITKEERTDKRKRTGKEKGTGKEKRTVDEGGILEVILDQTLFFPEEGGQTPDTGTLGGFPVIDVQLDGNVIRHFVRIPADDKSAMEIFVPGRIISGQIDFAHRFSNMQNHSGEHILSGLVHGKFGYDNVGFHLSDNTVTLDFNGPLSDEDILWLEKAANRVVWDDLEIRAWYPDEETLEKTPYRSKKEIDGPLRLVEIPGVDVCACCAPHVHRTGEIGVIKIIRTLRERSGIRLTILCGSRALEYLQQLQKAAEDTSHLTNMPREEIAAGVARILDENERLRQRESALETMVTDALAAAVPADREHVFLFTDGIGNLAQRSLVNRLCETHTGYCGVFNGNDGTGYKYIIGAGTPAGNREPVDARVLNACLNKSCGARGGGKPAMVQGSVQASEEKIRTALDEALDTP